MSVSNPKKYFSEEDADQNFALDGYVIAKVDAINHQIPPTNNMPWCESVSVDNAVTSEGMTAKLKPKVIAGMTIATRRDLVSTNCVHSQKPINVIAARAMTKKENGSKNIPAITKGARISAVIIRCFNKRRPLVCYVFLLFR
jgi:hypothetical protein